MNTKEGGKGTYNNNNNNNNNNINSINNNYCLVRDIWKIRIT